MKIYYRQDEGSSYFLSALGVRHCYVKQLFSQRDWANVIRRFHHHNGFEIHMILSGSETYETAEGTFQLKEGDYLIIPPRLSHRILKTSDETRKGSITFSIDENPRLLPISLDRCIAGSVPPRVRDAFDLILEQSGQDRLLSPLLIENRTAEILLLLFHDLSDRPPMPQKNVPQTDPRLALVKQYILDNIARPLSCDEVAAYCHLSTRQLSRLFSQAEGKTLTAYIHQQRISCIESLLSDPKLTLRDISERLHFSSEYYFNAFVKKHAGMTPGAYRKMISTPEGKEKES